MKNSENNKSLLRRYLDDLYTMDDARKLLDELQTSEYDTDMLQDLAAEVWEEASLQSPQTDLEREQYKKEARLLLKRIEHKKRMWIRRAALAVSSVAAMVCLVFGSISYIRYIDRTQVSYLEASTSFGERKEVQLPDGTTLILNSCSRVHYPDRFTGKERRIELEGEGYFRVYHNEKQPFIVDTRHFDVRVLGTCFNIKSYSSDEVVSVDVESGKVQVDLPEAMMRLRAKEQVLINTVSGEYNKRREERTMAVWRKVIYVSIVLRYMMWLKNWSVCIIVALLLLRDRILTISFLVNMIIRVWTLYYRLWSIQAVFITREWGI